MYLTVHSFGQMILYPWGYDSKAVARDKADLHSMAQVSGLSEYFHEIFVSGQVGARAMSTRYKVGHSATVSYETSGASDDWAKGVAGVKYSYTIELPDTGRYNFILPPSRIAGTVRDAVKAVKSMARELIKRSVRKSSS